MFPSRQRLFLFLAFSLLFAPFFSSCGKDITVQDEEIRPISELFREKNSIEKKDTLEQFEEKFKENKEEILEETFLDAGELPEIIAEKSISEQKPVGSRFRFFVHSKIEDIVPPQLKKISFSSSKIQAGKELGVYIEPKRDLSGVIAAQISLKSASGKNSLYITTNYHPSHKRFEGLIHLSPYLEKGRWSIARVTLMDAAGNPSVYLGSRAPLKGLFFEVENQQEDLIPPQLTAFHFLASSVKAGQVIRFSLQAKDIGPAGISDISVNVTDTKGQFFVSGRAFYHLGHRRYEGSLLIPQTASSDKWHIQSIELTDRADNNTSISSTDKLIKNEHFQVIKASSSPSPSPSPKPKEGKPLKILGAYLTPSKVEAGETIQVYVSAQDGVGGILRAQAAIADASGAARLFFSLWFNPSTRLWEGTTNIPLFVQGGIWSLKSLSFYDKAGNLTKKEGRALQELQELPAKRLQQHQKHLSFEILPVSANFQDRKPPIIKGIHLAPPVVSYPQKARLYARLQDPGGSGVAFASCTLRGPLAGKLQQSILAYNSDTGFYEGDIQFKKDDPAGKWWISGCYLQDRAGNKAPISGRKLAQLPPLDISRATNQPSTDPFIVKLKQPPASDTTPPSMEALNLAPSEVTQGQSLHIFARLHDKESGIARANCTFVSEVNDNNGIGQAEVSLSFNPQHQLWEGELTLPSEATLGIWLFHHCLVVDQAGNQKLWQPHELKGHSSISLPDISSLAKEYGRFLVKKRPSQPISKDKEAPKLLKMTLAPSKGRPLESIRFFLQATDNVGITQASCALKPSLDEGPHAPYGSVILHLNPISSFWEGNFRIFRQSMPGFWSVARCFLSDAAGNELKIDGESLSQVAPLDISSILNHRLVNQFTLKIDDNGQPPPQKDTIPPSIRKIQWYPSQKIQVSQMALLSIEAHDRGSGVAYVSAQIKDPLDREYSLRFHYNSATKRWESTIKFPRYGKNGRWKFVTVVVEDKAQNQKMYTAKEALLSQNFIDIEGTQPIPDKKPPLLLDLKRGKSIVVAGDANRFYLKIQDDSPLKSLWMQLYSPSKKYRLMVTFKHNPLSLLWEGEAHIPLHSENGRWFADMLHISDQFGNALLLKKNSSLLQKATFTVRGVPIKTDKTPPDIKKLMIFPKQIKIGESAKIYAEIVEKDSGIQEVSVILKHLKTARKTFISLQYNPATQFYETVISPTAQMPRGLWKISSISLLDKADNQKEITEKDPFLQKP